MAEIGNRKERLRDYASFPDEVPQAGFRAAALTYLPSYQKKVVSEQNAKHSAIETGLCGKAWLERFNIVNRREAEKGFGDNVPKWVWAIAQRNPYRQKRSFSAECEAFCY